MNEFPRFYAVYRSLVFYSLFSERLIRNNEVMSLANLYSGMGATIFPLISFCRLLSVPENMRIHKNDKKWRYNTTATNSNLKASINHLASVWIFSGNWWVRIWNGCKYIRCIWFKWTRYFNTFDWTVCCLSNNGFHRGIWSGMWDRLFTLHRQK